MKVVRYCSKCKKPLREWNRSGICSNCYPAYKQARRRRLFKERRENFKEKQLCIDCGKVVNPAIIYPDGPNGPKEIKYYIRCYKCRLKQKEKYRKLKLQSENKNLKSKRN